jgi:hypothetical protein
VATAAQLLQRFHQYFRVTHGRQRAARFPQPPVFFPAGAAPDSLADQPENRAELLQIFPRLVNCVAITPRRFLRQPFQNPVNLAPRNTPQAFREPFPGFEFVAHGFSVSLPAVPQRKIFPVK